MLGVFFLFGMTKFELNFRAIEMMCCSAIHVHFTHCVVRARLSTIPRREATSRSTHLLCELFHAVNMIFTKS